MNPDFGTFCGQALRPTRPWRGAIRARQRWPLLFLLLALCLLGAQTVQAQAQAQAQTEATLTRRPTALREAPAEASPSLAQLPANTPLDRLPERSGAWVKVRVGTATASAVAGATGWVHLFDLGTPEAVVPAGNPATGLLRNVTSFLSRSSVPQSATVTTSTIGVRGLGAEDIARAQPNPAAVDQMDALRTNGDAARQFAVLANLNPVTVAPLPSPAQPPGTGAGTGSPMGQRETTP